MTDEFTGRSRSHSQSRSRSHTQTRTRTHVRAGRRSAFLRASLAVLALARQLGVVLRRVRDEISRTVTPAGWIAVIVALGGFSLGWLFGWAEAIVAGIVSIVLLLLAVPFLFGARRYDVRVHPTADRVVAGGSVSTGVTVRNTGTRTALPSRLDLPVGDGIVEVEVPLLRPDADVTEDVEIPTPRRGVIRVGPATTVRADPLRLLHREHEWADVHELYVHPRTVPVPATSAGIIRDLEGNPTSRLVDSDISFHAIREYAPGDAQRQIHWKSTAKTGQLMVRQFEESRRARTAIALSVAAADYLDEDEYELAVSAAASLGVQSLREGRDLEIVAGAEIPRVVRGRLRAFRQLGAVSPRGLLDEFCLVDSLENTMALEEVCALQAEESSGLSIVFLVCGSRLPLERVRRAALAYGSETTVVAVVCNETAHPRVRPIGDLYVMTIGVLEDLGALLGRGAVR